MVTAMTILARRRFLRLQYLCIDIWLRPKKLIQKLIPPSRAIHRDWYWKGVGFRKPGGDILLLSDAISKTLDKPPLSIHPLMIRANTPAYRNTAWKSQENRYKRNINQAEPETASFIDCTYYCNHPCITPSNITHKSVTGKSARM